MYVMDHHDETHALAEEAGTPPETQWGTSSVGALTHLHEYCLWSRARARARRALVRPRGGRTMLQGPEPNAGLGLEEEKWMSSSATTFHGRDVQVPVVVVQVEEVPARAMMMNEKR